MQLEVQKPFEKDILSIRDKKLAILVSDVIQNLEHCLTIKNFKNLKKMNVKGNYFRIRIGNYRMGLELEGERITLLRFLHRKDLYKYFP